MNKEILIKHGYRRYNQPETEPTLYQKKVVDKKGIKYFINCHHYIFPERSPIKDSWEFKLQIESTHGIINTTLFNTDKTINQIEVFIEETWEHYGSIYYDKFIFEVKK